MRNLACQLWSCRAVHLRFQGDFHNFIKAELIRIRQYYQKRGIFGFAKFLIFQKLPLKYGQLPLLTRKLCCQSKANQTKAKQIKADDLFDQFVSQMGT